MSWTDERTAELTRLWNDGYSASQVASRLGGFSHCTDGGRSAVIGKAHRLGLAGRVTTSRTAHPPRKRKIPKLKSAHPWNFGPPKSPHRDGLPLPMPAADDKARVSFADLEKDHCRWIVGESRDVPADAPLFCGLKKRPGSPYCPGHFARAFVPVRPRSPSQVPALPAKVLEVA